MESISTKKTFAESLLDNAPCGFIVFNDAGDILRANKTVAEMLANTVADIEGKKFESLLSIAGKIFYHTHFFPLIRLHEKAEEIFLTLIAADKAEVPVLINAKRVLNAEGQYENHCVLMSVPQRKKYESELLDAKRSLEQSLNKNELLQKATQELEKSKQSLDRQVTRLSNLNKDLVQFSKVISHDLQEPIRKMAMFTDIIHREEHSKLSATSKTSLEKIKKESRRTRDLISCLQQYVSAENAENIPTPCDLPELITRAKHKAVIDSRFEDVDVTASGLLVIEGHSEQLELLFYHLLLNAIQFRKEDQRVSVLIEAEVIQQNSYQAIEGKYRYIDFLRIRLSDNGRGFGNQYKDYIFDLFTKVHPEVSGLGFGLALCKKIVQNHYGAITAASDGDGSVFTILLPVSQKWDR
ncbi:MAG TPA: ATP-binding protein [Flavipsychrobacter sp.]|nr:ATP-binding protein [Flavipsychrobacter sp.]